MHRLIPFLSVLFLAAACLSGCAAAARVPQAAPPGQPTLRVMTYNINFGGRGDPQALAAVRSGDADVVFLQETTPTWERAFRRGFSAQYPHQRWLHVRGGAGGMAVLSKHPFALKAIPAGPGWFDALSAEVATPIGPIEVLAVHLRPPVSDGGSFISGHFTTPAIRKGELQHHARHLTGAAPLIVVGDFNEDDDGSGVAWIRKAKGLTNALMAFDPDAETWRWPTWAMDLSDTFDHILYDRRLTCLNARVIQAGRSDHLPVVAEFVMADAARSGGQ